MQVGVGEKESSPGGDRCRARIIAKCYAQKEGVDYNKLFSPVVKHTFYLCLACISGAA